MHRRILVDHFFRPCHAGDKARPAPEVLHEVAWEKNIKMDTNWLVTGWSGLLRIHPSSKSGTL